MKSQNNMMFSTKKHDNDLLTKNCAVIYNAPWWFAKCHSSLLTGEYGKNISYASGITWSSPWGYYTFARYAAMMIRPNT